MAKKMNLKEFLSDDTLDLSLHNLQDVPVKEIAAIPKATSLDLSSNKLTILSKSFSTSLTHLVKLDLARNDLRELPKNFGCLVNLKHLDLYKNKIETLPLSFGNLKALRWLDIKDNPLEPHWHRIVGPCLNSQDCRAAAKNVVNIASMMNQEINEEVQRSQARQKQIEENELKEQAKKKEKQKEKKKRKTAAKTAEVNHKNVIVNGGLISKVEPISTVNEEPCEIPVKSDNKSSIGSKLKSVFFGLMWSIFYCFITFALVLLLLKFVNEPTYNIIMLRLKKYTQPVLTSPLLEEIRVIFQKLSVISIHNLKFVAQNTISIFQMLYKSIINAYVFLSTDPRVDLYIKLVVDSFLSLYIKICELLSMFFSNVTQIQTS